MFAADHRYRHVVQGAALMDVDVLAQLDAETATVRAELGRSEAKAGHLLTLAVAGLTVLVAVGPARHLPTAAAVLGGAGVLADLVGTVLLGLVLLPRLDGCRSGWPAHSRRTAAQVLDVLGDPAPEVARAALLVHLSRLAARKFRLIQLAEVALGLAVLLVLAAAVV
jgi:hypothetical protein